MLAKASELLAKSLTVTARTLGASQDQVRPALMLPLPSTTVILRFGGGGVVTTRTDGNGWVFLPAETAGERVVMDPLVEPFLEFDAPECVLAPTGENVLKQRLTVQDK